MLISHLCTPKIVIKRVQYPTLERQMLDARGTVVSNVDMVDAIADSHEVPMRRLKREIDLIDS